MTVSNDVHNLICSLTKKERSFVLKNFATKEKDDVTYIKLFEAMEKQKEYNETAIKKAIHYTKDAVAFSSLKNYLYEFIIDKLIYVNRHSNRILNSNNTLQELNILYNKELYPAFFKRWQKANLVAHEYEDYAMILALKEQMSNLRIRQIIKTDEEDFKKLLEEELYIIDHFSKLQLLKSLYNRLVLLNSKNYFVSQEADVQILQEIQNHNILQTAPHKKSSFRFIYYYYMSNAMALKLANQYQEAFEFLETLLPYFKTKIGLLSIKPIFIYDFVELFYPLCLKLNKSQLFYEVLQIPFIQKMYANDSHAFLSIFLQYSQLGFAQQNNNITHAIEARNNLIALLKNSKNIKHVHVERNIIASITVSFFIYGNYEDAYYWGKQYLIIGAKHKKADQYDFLHLLMVLISFELKQYTIFNSEVNNSYQYFYRHKKLGKLQASIINTLRKVPSTYFKIDRSTHYKNLQAKLNQVPINEIENTEFFYFNFLHWVNSKVDQVSYINYKQNNIS
jgi:hypothetical protein